MFHDFVLELIWLVDNGAHIDRTVISKILDDGKDVIQFLEYALPYRMDHSWLNKDPDRDFYIELIIRQYTAGREKHIRAKNNGILMLLQLCFMLSKDEHFDAYKEVGIEFYTGKLKDEELWRLKHVGVKPTEICYY